MAAKLRNKEGRFYYRKLKVKGLSVFCCTAMTTKDSAYQHIASLVERFDKQKASYKKTDYNETLVRRDFIRKSLLPKFTIRHLL